MVDYLKGDLAQFTENLPGAAFFYVVDADRNGSIRFLNDGCETIWGISAETLGDDPTLLWDMITPEDSPAVRASVAQSAKSQTQWEARFNIVDGNGVQKCIFGRSTPDPLPDGSVRWLTYLFDLTDQIKTEKLFEVVSDQLRFISSAIPDGFAFFDPEEKLVVCNSLFRSAYAIDANDDIKGRTYEKILSDAVDHGAVLEPDESKTDWIASALENFRSANSSREIRWEGGRWMRILDRPTEDGGRIAIRIEVTDAVHHKKELEIAAATDMLTGLANRRGLAQVLSEFSLNLKAPQQLVILHIDLDKFKNINDAFGHDSGDLVLSQTADKIRKHVGDDAHIARVGGDEFVVVLVTDQSECQLYKVAEELREIITRPIYCDSRIFQVGASVGLATWAPGTQESVEQVLMDADTALIAGKSQGRNQTVVFSKEMRNTAVTNARVATQIKDGLEKDAFLPFFQPQVAYPGRQFVGFEALARWKTGSDTYATAATFIDVANDTGLISAIERKILSGSLAALSRIARQGAANAYVSINLSSVQLRDPSLLERLMDELLMHGVSADRVNVEIVESTLLDDRSDTIAVNICRLAEAGFRIALDDFGTGHAALASLTRFPVDQIKIDRSLITDIDSEPTKRAIASGLFHVCENLGIETIAEGVETEAELTALREIGFSRFQGFYFARPMPVNRLLSWIDELELAEQAQ
ncbi:MAG: EAL domain-containing protein [Roseibium sp.]